MNKKIILISSLLGVSSVYAQSMDQSVISTSGNNFSTASTAISWTIGEVVIETVANGNNTLTQGFHQSELDVTSVQSHLPSFNISVYPNPIVSKLTINLGDYEAKAFLEIVDISGKTVHLSSTATNTNIDLSGLSSGVYFLSIKNDEDQILNTFKIQKVK